MRAIDEINYDGVYWKDIDWPDMPMCDYCTGDVGTGHQNACVYLLKNQESPAGRTWLRNMIKEAVHNGWKRRQATEVHG